MFAAFICCLVSFVFIFLSAVYLEVSKLTQHCSDLRRRSPLPHIRRHLSLRRACYLCRRTLDTHQPCGGVLNQYIFIFGFGCFSTPAAQRHACIDETFHVLGFRARYHTLTVYFILHIHAHNRTIIRQRLNIMFCLASTFKLLPAK
jgi:hypothetical protein